MLKLKFFVYSFFKLARLLPNKMFRGFINANSLLYVISEIFFYVSQVRPYHHFVITYFFDYIEIVSISDGFC